MSTSTSSSKSTQEFGKLPDKPWLKTMVVSLVLAGAMMATGETILRSYGFHPDIGESPDLWAFHRRRVYRDDGNVIVFLGASRMQADIALDVFRERLPDYRPVQLSISGSGSPIGTLEHLSRDETFRGIVICAAITPFLQSSRWADQSEYYLHEPEPIEQARTLAASYVRNFLSIAHPRHRLQAWLQGWWAHEELPKPRHNRRRLDGSLQMDFSLIEDLDAYRDRVNARFRGEYEEAKGVPPPGEFAGDLGRIEEMVERMQQRGCTVAFLRLPSSRERLQMEEDEHPQATYWDSFAQSSDAEWIHSAEIPSTSHLECPDDSHLDYRQAPTFTHALIDELLDRGVLRSANARVN